MSPDPTLVAKALEIADKITYRILGRSGHWRTTGLLEDALQEARTQALYALTKVDSARIETAASYIGRACWIAVVRWRRANSHVVSVPVNGVAWTTVRMHADSDSVCLELSSGGHLESATLSRFSASQALKTAREIIYSKYADCAAAADMVLLDHKSIIAAAQSATVEVKRLRYVFRKVKQYLHQLGLLSET